jgi:tetratricopeptide (TPR) repeat protein
MSTQFFRRLLFAPLLLLTFPGARGVERIINAPAGAAEDQVRYIEQHAVDENQAALDFEKQRDYASAAAVLERTRGLWPVDSNLLPALRSGVLANLADAYQFGGRWLEAAGALREAIAVSERAWGASDARTTRMEVRLGEAEVVLGQFASADRRLHDALDQQRRTAGESKAELAQTLATVAVLDVNIGRVAEAEQFAEEGLALAAEAEPGTAEYGSVMGVLAGVFVIERQNARAFPLLTRAIDLLESHTPDSVRVAPLLVQRGLIEADDHKYTLAERDMQRAIVILDGSNGPNINGDWARLHLARLYLAQGKVEEADTIVPPTIDRQRTFLGGAGRRLALCIRELARLRAMQKRYDEAAALYREILGMVGAPSLDKRPAAAGRHASEKDVRALEQRAAVVFDIPRGD